MSSNLENNGVIPGSTDGLDSSSTHDSSSSRANSESASGKGQPIVIGLFGSDGGDDLKNRFFRCLCENGLSLKESSSSPLRRGAWKSNRYTDKNVQIWMFPSLHDGTWLQKAEAFLCVAAYLKACTGRLHGVIYVQGIDDDEGDDALKLFKSLIGDNVPAQSLVLSGDPTEYDSDPEGAELLKTVLSSVSYGECAEIIERFLETSHTPASSSSLFQLEISRGKSIGGTTAGLLFSERLEDAKRMIERALDHIHGKSVSPPSTLPSPKSPSTRRRHTSTELSNELNATRSRFNELQDAYAALERNLSEQVQELEESNRELRSEKEGLEVKVEALEHELNELRLKTTPNRVETKEYGVQTNPPFEPKPAREELQNEVMKLKSGLADAKLAEADALKRNAALSEELAQAKAPLVDAEKSNVELKKKVTSFEKQVDSLIKTVDTKREEVEKAKGETTKANLLVKSAKEDLEKAQKQLKEYVSSRAKLEEERAKAIEVSEGLLKVKDGVEKQLKEANSRVDTVKKQAKIEVDRLKEALTEKDSQVREIARAAGVWCLASADVKRLEEEVKLLEDCRIAQEREAHKERHKLELELRETKEEWEGERRRLEASIASLNLSNDEIRHRFEVISQERDDEANGYMTRIAELEEWCEKRWDAVGNNCVIA